MSVVAADGKNNDQELRIDRPEMVYIVRGVYASPYGYKIHIGEEAPAVNYLLASFFESSTQAGSTALYYGGGTADLQATWRMFGPLRWARHPAALHFIVAGVVASGIAPAFLIGKLAWLGTYVAPSGLEVVANLSMNRHGDYWFWTCVVFVFWIKGFATSYCKPKPEVMQNDCGKSRKSRTPSEAPSMTSGEEKQTKPSQCHVRRIRRHGDSAQPLCKPARISALCFVLAMGVWAYSVERGAAIWRFDPLMFARAPFARYISMRIDNIRLIAHVALLVVFAWGSLFGPNNEPCLNVPHRPNNAYLKVPKA